MKTVVNKERKQGDESRDVSEIFMFIFASLWLCFFPEKKFLLFNSFFLYLYIYFLF